MVAAPNAAAQWRCCVGYLSSESRVYAWPCYGCGLLFGLGLAEGQGFTDALPAHRDLDRALQSAQRTSVQHPQALPYHRDDPKQPDLDLHDIGYSHYGRCGIGISIGSRLLRRSGHQPTLSRLHRLSRGHHTLSHGPRPDEQGRCDRYGWVQALAEAVTASSADQ